MYKKICRFGQSKELEFILYSSDCIIIKRLSPLYTFGCPQRHTQQKLEGRCAESATKEPRISNMASAPVFISTSLFISSFIHCFVPWSPDRTRGTEQDGFTQMSRWSSNKRIKNSLRMVRLLLCSFLCPLPGLCTETQFLDETQTRTVWTFISSICSLYRCKAERERLTCN